MFDNYQAITRIRCPVLLIHGKQDTLVKPYHSRLLNDRVSPGVHHTFTLIDEAGHNDIWKREYVQSFLPLHLCAHCAIASDRL